MYTYIHFNRFSMKSAEIIIYIYLHIEACYEKRPTRGNVSELAKCVESGMPISTL